MLSRLKKQVSNRLSLVLIGWLYWLNGRWPLWIVVVRQDGVLIGYHAPRYWGGIMAAVARDLSDTAGESAEREYKKHRVAILCARQKAEGSSR